MKNKILLGVVVILSFILVGVICSKKETNHFFSEEEKIKIQTDEEKIEELNLEEYLVGVLAAEMPASFHEEALKAQAVASRTYAMYKMNQNKDKEYDILTDVTNQSYITEEKMKQKWGKDYEFYLNKIKQAVKETEKEVMLYNDEIIESFYFAMSNGKTEEVQTVFQENLPYIKSVESSWDNETLNNFVVTTNFSKKEFCEKLNLEDCTTININDIQYTSTNRVDNITINHQQYSGTIVRKNLNLRSTDFSIEIIGEKILITTRGYGHGVGMSQYGANGMAVNGANYKEILNYYYKDITIKKLV